MPHGRPKAGRARVAGVTSEEIRARLLFLTIDRDLPSLSAALGAALDEWATCCGNRAMAPDRPRTRGHDATASAGAVLHHSGMVLHPPEGGGDA